MAITLVVEDGTGLSSANSYDSVTNLRAYAALRGESIPSDNDSCAIAMVKAFDALLEESPFLRGMKYVGRKANQFQAGAWPRVDARVEDWCISSTEIPRQLQQAQCAIAIEILNGVDLLPTVLPNDGGRVISETIGPISTTYVNQGAVGRTPAIAKADALLRTLLQRNGLFVVRA